MRHTSRLVFAVAGLLASAPLLASSAPTRTHFLGLPNWVWAWANLIVLGGLVYKLIWPAAKAFLIERRAAVAEAAATAERQRKEAEEMSQRLDRQVAELKQQMAELVERSEQEGEAEKVRILEQAEAEAERIKTQAEAEIRNRTAQARAQLSAFAAELAAEIATRKVEGELSAADRDRLFAEQLERLGEQIS